MTWYTSPLVFLFLIFRSYNGSNDFLKIQMSGFAQGTTWHITYYAADSAVKQIQVDSILTRLDSSLSIYKPFSLISRFNASKKGLVIDDHFAAVVHKSIEAWQQSGGLFDITVQPLVQAWGFSAKPVNIPVPRGYGRCWHAWEPTR